MPIRSDPASATVRTPQFLRPAARRALHGDFHRLAHRLWCPIPSLHALKVIGQFVPALLGNLVAYAAPVAPAATPLLRPAAPDALALSCAPVRRARRQLAPQGVLQRGACVLQVVVLVFVVVMAVAPGVTRGRPGTGPGSVAAMSAGPCLVVVVLLTVLGDS